MKLFLEAVAHVLLVAYFLSMKNMPAQLLFVLVVSVAISIAYRLIPWPHKRWATVSGAEEFCKVVVGTRYVLFATISAALAIPFAAQKLSEELPPILEEQINAMLKDDGFIRKTEQRAVVCTLISTTNIDKSHIGMSKAKKVTLTPTEIIMESLALLAEECTNFTD